MRIFNFLFLLFLVNPLLAQTEISQQSEAFLEDFKIYREIIEKSHSGLYLYTTKPEFDSIYNEAESRIRDNEIGTRRDFNLLLARVHTHINCGHSNVFPSSAIFNEIDDSQPAFFPVKLKILKDTLIVAETYKHLRKGTQIKGINGRDFNMILNDMYKVISSDGYNTTLKDRYLEEEFSNYYFLLYGGEEKFEMEIVSSETNQIETTAIPACVQARRKELLERPDMIDYQLQFPDDETAILTVNSFATDQKKFFVFLRRSFEEINDKNIQKLIVDVRQNTGGDDGNDTKLASYLIDGSFQDNKYRLLNTVDLPIYPEYLDSRWAEMMDIPSNLLPEEIAEELKKMLEEEYYLGNDNKYYIRDEYICKELPPKNLYTGTCYILTGGKVFSAGSLFCALVKDKSNAIFVGEEVGGGYYRHTGSYPLAYVLPNSKLSFSLSIVVNEQDIEHNLMPRGRGVIPDFEIYQTIDEYVNDRDAVMEFVKEKQIIKCL